MNRQMPGGESQRGTMNQDSVFVIDFRRPINATMKVLFWTLVGLPFALGLIFGFVPRNAGFISGLSQTIGVAGNRAVGETINTTRPVIRDAQESVNESFEESSFSQETIDALNEDTD